MSLFSQTKKISQLLLLQNGSWGSTRIISNIKPATSGGIDYRFLSETSVSNGFPSSGRIGS